MAGFVYGFDGNPFTQYSIDKSAAGFIRSLVRLKPNVAYVAGGITLDFTNGGGSAGVPSAMPPNAVKIAMVQIVSNGPAGSVGANGGNYVFLAGTSPTNGKLKIFATAGTEYAAGAFGTDVTTDVILAEVWWTRK